MVLKLRKVTNPGVGNWKGVQNSLLDTGIDYMGCLLCENTPVIYVLFGMSVILHLKEVP